MIHRFPQTKKGKLNLIFNESLVDITQRNSKIPTHQLDIIFDEKEAAIQTNISGVETHTLELTFDEMPADTKKVDSDLPVHTLNLSFDESNNDITHDMSSLYLPTLTVNFDESPSNIQQSNAKLELKTLSMAFSESKINVSVNNSELTKIERLLYEEQNGFYSTKSSQFIVMNNSAWYSDQNITRVEFISGNQTKSFEVDSVSNHGSYINVKIKENVPFANATMKLYGY